MNEPKTPMETDHSLFARTKRLLWRREVLVIGVLFAVFFVVHASFLGHVPGLMGDEGSEGENVRTILEEEKRPVMGERSYISVWIDYARVPFVHMFGYGPIALRLPILIANAVLFWLMWWSLRLLFGRTEALLGMTALAFSPIFLLYGRLGWAISLLPFFGALTLFGLVRGRMRAEQSQSLFYGLPLLTGFAAGIGLATHILFLPTIAALFLGWLLLFARTPRVLVQWWPALIGFWAGFGMQFTILRLFQEDQGAPAKVFEHFSERFEMLPELIPPLLSGSGYVARYLGSPLPEHFEVSVAWTVVGLALAAVVFGRHRIAALGWIGAIIAHLVILFALIEFTSLRYFVVPALAAWALAGVGLGSLLSRIGQLTNIRETMRGLVAPAVSGVLIIILLLWINANLLQPYLRTGGSTDKFKLGNITENAAALVDTRGLYACVSDLSGVWSENIHIRHRLQYFQGDFEQDLLAKDLKSSDWILQHREEETLRRGDEKCPELRHFRVVPGHSQRAKERGGS